MNWFIALPAPSNEAVWRYFSGQDLRFKQLDDSLSWSDHLVAQGPMMQMLICREPDGTLGQWVGRRLCSTQGPKAIRHLKAKLHFAEIFVLRPVTLDNLQQSASKEEGINFLRKNPSGVNTAVFYPLFSPKGSISDSADDFHLDFCWRVKHSHPDIEKRLH